MDKLAVVHQEERDTSIRNWQTGLGPSNEHDEHGIAQRLFLACMELFQSQLMIMKRSHCLSKPISRKFGRALGLMKIWYEESGAALGHLDRQLDLSDNLKRLVLRAIADIAETLALRLSKFVPECEVREDEKSTALFTVFSTLEEAAYSSRRYVDSDSDDESDTSDYEDDSLSEIASDLLSETPALDDLHLALRNPTLQQIEAPAGTNALVPYKASLPFENRVSARFPLAAPTVVACLGEANLARSIRGQRERTGTILEQNVVAGTEKSIMDSGFRDSGLGTSVPSEAPTIATVMSFYSPTGDCIRFPPLPPTAIGQSHKCGCCNKTIRISNKSGWKRHLVQDLQPYSCFLDRCTDKHMTFQTRPLWAEHLATDHQFANDWTSFNCPLCATCVASGRINVVNHLATHLEEIALAALPLSMYDLAQDDESADDLGASSGSESESTQNDVIEIASSQRSKPIATSSLPETAEVAKHYSLAGVDPEDSFPAPDRKLEQGAKGSIGSQNDSPGIDHSTISCICGDDQDDGGIILCEICDTWQHIKCYYPSLVMPDVHECTDCRQTLNTSPTKSQAQGLRGIVLNTLSPEDAVLDYHEPSEDAGKPPFQNPHNVQVEKDSEDRLLKHGQSQNSILMERWMKEAPSPVKRLALSKNNLPNIKDQLNYKDKVAMGGNADAQHHHHHQASSSAINGAITSGDKGNESSIALNNLTVDVTDTASVRALKRSQSDITSTPPYACPICPNTDCPRAFSRKADLSRHIMIRHDEERRKHACPVCDRTYLFSKDLVRHIATHPGDRAYITCGVCEKKFAWKDYHRHFRTSHEKAA